MCWKRNIFGVIIATFDFRLFYQSPPLNRGRNSGVFNWHFLRSHRTRHREKWENDRPCAVHTGPIPHAPCPMLLPQKQWKGPDEAKSGKSRIFVKCWAPLKRDSNINNLPFVGRATHLYNLYLYACALPHWIR